MDAHIASLAHPDSPPDTAPDHSTSTDSADRASTFLSDTSSVTDDTEHSTASVILAPLQEKGRSQETHEYDPLEDEDSGSYDLVAPPEETPLPRGPSIEESSKLLMSKQHLQAIFAVPSHFQKFAGFLAGHRRSSVPVLVYYLDALKSLRAIAYANSLARSLEPVGSLDFTQVNPEPLINKTLQEKTDKAFDALVQSDLPAYMTHTYINIVSPTIAQRISGTLAPHLVEASEGLAEVFCLTDPSREDNPIVFASEEFTKTTQYGLNYIIGRNCRFLQGPDTDRKAVRRLKESLEAGREHNEILLNYRRDGSPFLNLLMMAPLTDSHGRLRYFIGAQIDVSGLVKAGIGLEELNKTLNSSKTSSPAKAASRATSDPPIEPFKDDFESLCELFNHNELKTVSDFGARIYREEKKTTVFDSDSEDEEDVIDDKKSSRRMPDIGMGISAKPRLLIREHSSSDEDWPSSPSARLRQSPDGRLSGVFQQYLLVRPYPSLRILFTSPSLRVPGILQSSIMSRIGGSSRVRDNLSAALAEGRGVTAKVKWMTRFDADGGGRSRHLHFTPLIGAGGKIGVWMVVVVDADDKGGATGMGREELDRKMAPVVTRDGRGGAAMGWKRHSGDAVKGDKYHALRREEAYGGMASRGGSIRGASREGSALSVRI